MLWMPFWRFSVLFRLILSHFVSILGPPGTNFSMILGDTGFALFFCQLFGLSKILCNIYAPHLWLLSHFGAICKVCVKHMLLSNVFCHFLGQSVKF